MDTHALRNYIFLFLGILFLTFSPLQAGGDYPEYDEALVIERLKSIEQPLVDYRFNSVVKGYIKGYLYWNRRKAELVTGRTVLYYPMIEQYLKEYGLPDKLKYLPVVESALNPHAVSPVGAVGLWQFMPGTATDHGLRIDKFVDERKDPHKATQAALAYLAREYEKYGDWALALAAYNGGSGRVSRAIKRGRSKNFWKLRRYMPRETRNYVPAYIAATYLMEYYKEHEITPDYPGLELQLTESVQVYQAISFHRIAQVTGLSLELIELLNPAYLKGIIPENQNGNYVILPSRVMQAFRDYLEAQRPDQLDEKYFDDTPVVVKDESKGKAKYQKALYIVGDGESLEDVSRRLSCSVHQLIAWNALKTDSISVSQELIYYRAKELVRFNPLKPMEIPAAIERLPLQKNGLESLTASTVADKPKRLQDYIIYIAYTREKLSELAARLPGISLPMLMDYNQLPSDYKLRIGDHIMIPRL